MKYPETKKDQVIDTFYGVAVEDPYRWLEDDNSEETAQWVKAQNKLTFNYLKSLPYRNEINKRLTELWDYPRSEAPFILSGRWFVYKNNGLQNQNVLYTMDTPTSAPVVLLDPNTLSNDGTVAFAGMDITPDGKYMAYKIARSGSDWNEIYVMDMLTKQLLRDHIQWVKFSGLACLNTGFYYSAYDKPNAGEELSLANKGQKIYFHQFGTDQSSDQLVYANAAIPQRMYGASLDEKREMLFITETESTSGNGLYVQLLKSDKAKVIKLADGFDYDYTPVAVLAGKVIVLTNDGAPKYRIVAIDPQKPEKENWTVLIPESENTLLNVDFCGGKFFANYMADAKSKLEIFSESGFFLGDVKLPGICTVTDFNGDNEDSLSFYAISSFNNPGTIYKYNTSTNVSEEYFTPELKFNPDDLVVEQEFYKSKDGTQIPMFLVHKKGLKKDGKNPTLLYAYGGFNISLTPSFSTSVIFFVENGGIYALPNIRGGGEYGEAWHKAGTLMQKQNVFDDFIAAAEHLISEGYTNPEKLAIRGGSNGGLLMGAVTNQRPDLFKAVIPAVGVMDMLRYQKFTIGYAWATDYGTVDESKEMFNYLLSYSPIHNVEAKTYPAILVTTADHDDRVVPAHSFKYISRIQELNTGKLPTLIRIDVKAGHGSGKPTAKLIEEYTDIYAFLFKHLGVELNK
jgi:prolyl oligopeptidase